MRLHALEITAFGPFTDTVSIDFDRLAEAGLFLLSGPTGAGKTSVLDAVCFALYGDVPGDRSAAKRLRSDHAEAGVAPRVVLEATLSGRRFRLTRSPAWERPKKRGSGTTTQQASVVVEELTDTGWTTHTTRLDEAGHLVSGLLGMTLTQFTQVAMLPQGRFQAFLRARAEERKALLQQLFRTQRFTDVEHWLRDRRIELRRASETMQQCIADLVSRASEATETSLPESWDVADLSVPAGEGELTRWILELQATAKEDHDAASTDAADAASWESDTRQRLEEGRALAERRSKVAAAAAEHADLTAAAEEHDLAVAAVDAAARAARVLPVHRLAERARSLRDTAVAAAPDHAETDRDAVRAETEQVSTEIAAARELLPVQDRLLTVCRQLRELDTERDRLSRRVEKARTEREELPERIAQIRDDLRESQDARGRLPVLESRLQAHLRAEELAVDLAEARKLHAEARDRAQDARERVLDVRQARLDGMAAELAQRLAVGGSCPVCGSADHPQKATADSDAPDEDTERAAQRASDDASAEEHARATRVRDLETRLEIARHQRGDDEISVDTLEEDLDRLRGLVGRLPQLEERYADCTQEQERLGQLIADLTARSSQTEASIRHLTAERTELTERLDRALEGADVDDVATLVRQLEERGRALRDRLARIEEAIRAEQSLREAEQAVEEACASAGFADLAEALDAALDDAVVQELSATIKHHDRRLAAVSAILAEPGATELLDQPALDVDGLTRTHREALEALNQARSALSRSVDRLARVSDLREKLAAELERWEPVRADLELTTRLAQFAEGKSADNPLQMSLSAYVVAYRLTQVVAAANERLATMSDGRYSLEHTAQRGAGDRRGGLSLMVRDDWSGESRDPATLSGGETFVVSLALALGLADVITQEAGGAMLDTLFVDEGFGSLDADTLDDVMDVLDGLRDGGRVVGVVSHVAEMRDRIPAQLQVVKRRTGSSVQIVGA